MADEEANRQQNDRRQPRNMQGLLRFAIEATRSEDAPNPSNYEAMSLERRQFLEEALKSMTFNVVEQLEYAAKTLTDERSSETEQISSIETIMDYVDNIDTANDFCKIGGLEILLICLKSPFESVRSHTSSLIAELAQNNPFCQKLLLEMNAIPKLIELLENRTTSTKAIHALSCIVRCYEPCCAEFIEVGGLECLLGCLQREPEKLRIQSLFLMSALCAEHPGIRDEFVKLKAVDQVIEILEPSGEYNVLLETTLAVLNILTEHPEAAAVCQNARSNVRGKLNETVRLSAGKSECQETVEFCQSLLFKLFNCTITDTNTDR